jgi:hypothetical protein
VPDAETLLTALIHARRAGDERAVPDALTRLVERGIRIRLGDSIPPQRTPTNSTACVLRSGR